MAVIDDERPIFMQIAERIENDIIDGVLAEESQVPSTNELAAFYRINPATALKGINRLVDDGVLFKKRGIGMFVASGARERLISSRRGHFAREYLRPLLAEAAKLGISPSQLGDLLRDEANSAAGAVADSTTQHAPASVPPKEHRP